MNLSTLRHLLHTSLLTLAMLLLPGTALADSITKTPKNCTSVATIGTAGWSSSSKAKVSDNGYADSKTSGTATHYLECTDYGFSIPSGAIINGVTVLVERKSSSATGSQDAAVRLIKGGVYGSANRATTSVYTTSDLTESHGGATDLWGDTWSATEINSSTFGAAFAATKMDGVTVSVDVISITVDYILDTTPPTVVSINRANPSPSGSASVSWTVTFSESVTGVDTGDFSLVQASGVSGATISSVTGSGTTWTVTAGTGSGSGTLGLNLSDNDSIADASGNKLGGSGTNGPANGSFTGQVYSIDKTNPYVQSIALAGTSPTNTTGSLSWTVTFTKAVTGVDAGDFALSASGVSGAAISAVSGSGTTWTVTASSGTGSGTLGLNLGDNDTIIDSTSNKLGGTGTGNASFTGAVYTIDRTAPAVSSIARVNVNPASSDTVSWTVTFSESVTGVNSADFALAVANLTGAYVQSVSGSGTTWTVVANTGLCTGVCSLGLNLVDDDSIVDTATNPLGGTGSGNGNFTGQVYTISSTPPIAQWAMDDAAWNGTQNEVTDSTGSYPGTAGGGAAAIVGDTGTCRYGVFDNGGTINSGYVSVLNFPDLTNNFTITGWIRTTDNSRAGQRIFIDDERVGQSGCGTTLSCLGYGLTLGDAGTGTLRFYARGSSVVNLDSAAVINNNTWYFVAAVADIASGQRRLYVYNNAGTLLTSTSVNATWPATAFDDGNASIGGTLPTSTLATSTYHFRGNLDDVRVYGKVLQPAALALLAQTSQACATAGPNRLQIEHATGTGLTCAASTLTIRACSDAAPACSPYTAGVSGTLSATGSPTVNWDSTSGGAIGSGFVIPSGSSSVTKSVQVASAGSVVLGVATSTPAAPGATACTFGSPACTFTAATAGFIFSASATGSSANIATQTAGTATSAVYLRAVQASTTNAAVCTPAIVGQSNVAVTMGYTCNNPSTCQSGNYLNVNATGLPSTGGSVSLNFDANGASQLSLRYDDVGQITLSASRAQTPVSGGTSVTLSGASNAFVVRPSTLTVSAVNATATTARPAGGLVKAGEPFSATVTAQNALGSTTPSFGKEGASVLLTPSLVTPATGNNPAISNGTIPGSEFGSTGMSNDANGVARVTNLSWTEVGSITLTPTVSDYLGTGALTGTASATVGRFYPNHFAVSGTPSVTPACGFAYFGQSNAVAVSAVVEARNLADARTQNYVPGYASTLASLALVGADSVNGTDQSSRLTQLACSWSSGQCSLSGSTAVAKSTATPSSPDNPFAALQLGLKITDSTDGANFNSLTMNPATAGSCSTAGTCNAQAIGSAFPVRFGQLALFPGYGSELAAMAVPMQLQYWNGSAFVLNGLDTCTSISPAMVSLSGWSGNLTTGSTSVSSVAAFSGGKSTVRLSAPGAGKTGRVGVSIGLTSNARSHLWVKPQGGSSFSADPATTANFGLYRASPNVIHLRESY